MKGERVARFAAGMALCLMSQLALSACYRQDMADQPRYDPFEQSTFFADGLSSRPIPEGAVARTSTSDTVEFLSGRSGEQLVETMPVAVDLALLRRGRERYDIFCSPCHDRTGSGNGMAVVRGFQRLPPSFHMDRLRDAADGHFFDVITRGFGAMQSYASEIAPRDRWAIVAYVRALQLSRNATLADVPPEEQGRTEEWTDER